MYTELHPMSALYRNKTCFQVTKTCHLDDLVNFLPWSCSTININYFKIIKQTFIIPTGPFSILEPIGMPYPYKKIGITAVHILWNNLDFSVYFGDFFYKVSLDVKKKSVAASNKTVDCPFDKSITEYVRMFRRSSINVQFQHMLFKP